MTPTAYGNYRPAPYQRPALTQRSAIPMPPSYPALTNNQMVQGASLAGLRPSFQRSMAPLQAQQRQWYMRFPGATGYPMPQQQPAQAFNPAQWARTGAAPLWSRQGGFGQRYQSGGGSDFINQLLAQHAAGAQVALPGYPPAQAPMQFKQPTLDRFPY